MIAKLKKAEDNNEPPKFMRGLGGMKSNKIKNNINNHEE